MKFPCQISYLLQLESDRDSPASPAEARAAAITAGASQGIKDVQEMIMRKVRPVSMSHCHSSPGTFT